MTLLTKIKAIQQQSIRRLAVGSAFLVTLIFHFGGEKFGLSQAIEFSFRDTVQQIFARPMDAPNVVLVDISEDSLRRIGPWPWSRAHIADLSQAALDAGARLVVLDMVFPEPRDRQGDQRLLDLAMSKKLVLSQAFDYVNRTQINSTGTPSGSTGDATAEITGSPMGTPATGYVANHEFFYTAPCVGNIGFIPDDDGKLRRLVLFTQWKGQFYPALSLAAVNCNGNDQTLLTRHIEENSLVLRMQRTDASFTAIPAHELLSGKNIADASLLNNKIVIIGSSALGLSDRVATPLSASTSGMLVHAHAIEQLLDTKTHHPLAGLTVLAMGLIFITVAAWLLSIQFSLRRSLLLFVFISTLWLAFAIYQALLESNAFLTGPVWGLLALISIYLLTELSKTRRDIRNTVSLLSRYVAKPVLDELLKNKNFDPLKLRHADITVVVVDMANYSTTIAGLELESAASLTRRYLECLTASVWSNLGTLDRYTGDGLVAFWGAPVPNADHAKKAFESVRQMQKNIDRLNESLMKEGLPTVQIRAGISSGSALVGDFGTHYRATYTAVGSCINIASRLENKAKELNISILANELFAHQIGPTNCLSLGFHDVRGLGELTLYSIEC